MTEDELLATIDAKDNEIEDLKTERESLKEELENAIKDLQDLKKELTDTKKLNFTLARQVDRTPTKNVEDIINEMF